jgi:hypothetical protein
VEKASKGVMKRKIALKLSIKNSNLGQSCEELPIRDMQKFRTQMKGTMQR